MNSYQALSDMKYAIPQDYNEANLSLEAVFIEYEKRYKAMLKNSIITPEVRMQNKVGTNLQTAQDTWDWFCNKAKNRQLATYFILQYQFYKLIANRKDKNNKIVFVDKKNKNKPKINIKDIKQQVKEDPNPIALLNLGTLNKIKLLTCYDLTNLNDRRKHFSNNSRACFVLSALISDNLPPCLLNEILIELDYSDSYLSRTGMVFMSNLPLYDVRHFLSLMGKGKKFQTDLTHVSPSVKHILDRVLEKFINKYMPNDIHSKTLEHLTVLVNNWYMPPKTNNTNNANIIVSQGATLFSPEQLISTETKQSKDKKAILDLQANIDRLISLRDEMSAAYEAEYQEEVGIASVLKRRSQ